jgi:flagellar biosynthesis regulator FlbT
VDQLVIGYFTVNGMSIIRQSQDLPTQPFESIHRVGCVWCVYRDDYICNHLHQVLHEVRQTGTIEAVKCTYSLNFLELIKIGQC